MRGKAKRKTITNAMVLSLIDVAKRKKQPEWEKMYWNTYHCQNQVYTANGKSYGTYCKNRMCTVCLANRKAEIMNSYLPIIKEWKNAYFVTLTVKSVSAKKLKWMLQEGVLRAFRQIVDKHKKQYQRGKGIKLMGIKSLECNFNPITRTYNPHLHIIVSDKEMADILIEEWLKKWGRKFTIRLAQKSVKVGNKEKALIEIIKYGSKIFTQPDVEDKSKGQRNGNIHVAALHNIFVAMNGIRIFDRFGFDVLKCKDFKQPQTKTLVQYMPWSFDSKQADWINPLTPQTLRH